MKTIFLEGEKIYLRPIDMDDLDIFYKMFNNPELRKFISIRYPIPKIKEKEILEKMIKDENSVPLSIIVKKNDKLIGNISLFNINKIHRNAEVGIIIGELDETSKGYGTEAMRLLIDYGFNMVNLHRIELQVYDFNERAINTYKKLGFIEEGKRRESIYFEGEYCDLVWMSVLREEWIKDK